MTHWPELIKSKCDNPAMGVAERISEAAKHISIHVYTTLWLDTPLIKVGMAHERIQAAIEHDFSCIFLILTTNMQKVAPCRSNIQVGMAHESAAACIVRLI